MTNDPKTPLDPEDVLRSEAWERVMKEPITGWTWLSTHMAMGQWRELQRIANALELLAEHVTGQFTN